MSRGSGLYEVVTTAGVPVRLHDMRPPNGWRHGSAQQAKVGPLARLREGPVKVGGLCTFPPASAVQNVQVRAEGEGFEPSRSVNP